ncbi:UNVERIFIED_ASMBLY: envelope glycoprotein N [human gammaherpesvirus 4]|uniref:BLRF1 n=1 Tax=Epstein-Barr virus (strain GD1) TaxID=10376 RepID=A0A3R5U3J2_EBVG|nr:BLRF1 [human gammaherpesvirus 4]QAJ45436.1 BLRF1 [human gammaherpesvirus 4]QAJ77087.1 BLRF1 [human gammaherpesvirus 4]QCF48499.1 envelope glycoprotein N [human gammaherpesvirus 4]
MGKVLRKPFAKAVPLLFLAATWLLAGVLPAGASSPTNAAAASLTEAQDQFYSYTCNADTFSPSLTSFASIWALLTLVLVIIASAIYLMYVCFNKFVNTLLTD